MSIDDVQDNARKTGRAAKNAASDRLGEIQDDLIVYTQEKPLMALLAAFALGVIVGKVVI